MRVESAQLATQSMLGSSLAALSRFEARLRTLPCYCDGRCILTPKQGACVWKTVERHNTAGLGACDASTVWMLPRPCGQRTEKAEEAASDTSRLLTLAEDGSNPQRRFADVPTSKQIRMYLCMHERTYVCVQNNVYIFQRVHDS